MECYPLQIPITCIRATTSTPTLNAIHKHYNMDKNTILKTWKHTITNFMHYFIHMD
jgi:hypothetical protein